MPHLRFASALLAIAWISVAACGGDTTGSTGGAGGVGGGGVGAAAACDPTPKTGDFPCDVFAIIKANCHECHTDPVKGGAPFPLLTYADTQGLYGPKKLISQQMYDQIQPGATPRMPLNGSLSAADQKTLEDWLAACAPPEPAGMGCGCPGTGCE